MPTPELTRNQRLVEAFSEAKRLLWDGKDERPLGKEQYICYALGASEASGAVLAESIVSKRLGTAVFAESWVERAGRADIAFDRRKMQQWRRAWLDKLIAEFSE